MKTRSWFRNLVARPNTRRVRKAQHRVRLALEALEDRRVLSILAPRAVPSATPIDVMAPQVIPLEVRGPQGTFVPSGPNGYTPQQLQTAYGLNQVSFGGIKGDGAGQTIALVDGFDNPGFVNSTDPNFATSTLHSFDQTFGLRDPPSFIKVNESGQTAPLAPPAPRLWGTETAGDIEWAHAMAPAASIILLEANATEANGFADLFTAAATAGKLASVVSNSWGLPEFSGELSLDSIFQAPGVTFLAVTGDNGAPGNGYPGYSPHVVAVGGTSLYNLDANGDYPGTGTNGEVGWSLRSDSFKPSFAGGGGISRFESEPSYQSAVQSTGFRTIPDISADADPATGVPVYDPYDFGLERPWNEGAGTSIATPLMAGMVAIADQGRVLSGGQRFSSDQFLADLYSLDQTNPSDFHDIIHGYNGFDAGPGYDEVTGLGTPNGSQLVPDLAYFGLSSRPLLQSIAVTPVNPSVGEGLSERFTATGIFQGGVTQDISSSVVWASATPAVATIDTSGLATMHAAGTSAITASLDGITSPGVTLTSLRLVSLAVALNDPFVPVLMSIPFTVTGTYSDGSTHALPSTLVAWASANSAVATINSAGLATAHALGTSAITASLDGVTSIGDVLSAITPSFVVSTTDDSAYTAGETSLRQAILTANADPGHTITFDPAVFKKARTITLTLGELELTDTTGTETIRGPAAGVTVNGGGLSRVFQVDAGVTASLSGLTIIGGNSVGFGGGLYNSGTATLTNCTVSGNSAGFGGGVLGFDATTTLTNCTVSGNSAGTSGGGVAAMYGSLALTNCTVSGNSAAEGSGGGLVTYFGASLALSNCTVSDNSDGSPYYGGGGLLHQGPATLTNCTVSGNSVSSPFGSGGGVWNAKGYTTVVTNCTISGNSASYGGGMFNDHEATAVLTNCTVSGNSASSRYLGGGGLVNEGAATLTNCTVSGNSATRDWGGGVYNLLGGTATLTNCTISGNSASHGGGGVWNAYRATATLTNCTVSGNSAGHGGGVENFNGQVTLTNCTVSGNSSSSVGGGLENVSVGYDFSDRAATATLINCTVSGNSAADGGGLFNQGTTTLTNCALKGNFATTNGGGLYNQYATATLTNCTVSGNSASGGGGVWNAYGSTATLTNCTIHGNSATGGSYYDRFGGGVANINSQATLTNCTVGGNSASGLAGGGVANISSPHYSSGSAATAAITNCTVSGNSAGAGGGMDTAGYVYFNGGKLSATTTLTNCTISGNSATGDGGGLDNASLDTTTLTNCTVSGDSANAGGGISNQGTLNASNCTIDKNQASAGGGIATTSGSVTLTNVTVNKNQATSSAIAQGGAIYSANTLVSLTNGTVNGNQATGSTAQGGGIYAYQCTVDMQNSTVNANEANGTVLAQGGGIYAYQTTVDMKNSTVNGNRADGTVLGQGGGIYGDSTTVLTLTNSTVKGNKATTSGNDIFL